MVVFCVHLVTDQPCRPGQVVWSVSAGGMDCPSRTVSHPAGSLSSSQPGGPQCWASHLAFVLIGCVVRDKGRRKSERKSEGERAKEMYIFEVAC